MKKQFLGLALLATVAVSGAFATMKTPVKKQPANVYTYYLEGDCNTPQYCSTDYQGAICSEEFSGLTVYDEQGCAIGHEVTNIIGKRPL